MLHGHGDDKFMYRDIHINFSSNIYNHFNHQGLFQHLRDSLHLSVNYPEPTPLSLEKVLAGILCCKPEEVMVTNGATEAIYLIACTFRQYNAIIPQPTFSEYADACVENKGNRNLRWFCIPNNPTGEVMPLQQLRQLIANHPEDVFVIDASYASYTTKPYLTVPEALSHDNVIMLHSMTKEYGIPGLRLGYVTANIKLLDLIKAHRMPWSVNALAIEAGHYLLTHREEYHIPAKELIMERQRVEKELQRLGITTAPSDSHMLLCQLPHGTSAELKRHLAEHHAILIRDASNFQGLGSSHFRIAVQSKEENDILINAIATII